MAVIAAEEKILDLERGEQEKGYIEQIKQIRVRRLMARQKDDKEELKATSELRKKLIQTMDKEKLEYEIKKLKLAQRKSPNPETIKKIEKLERDLELLEPKDVTK